MRALWGIGAAACVLGCIPGGSFICEDDAQCSRFANGLCQAGGCSYPDPDCDSGRRYGEFAGPLAGTCVPVPGGGGSSDGPQVPSGTGSTSSTSGTTVSGSSDDTMGSDDSGSTGIPTICDGVDCSGQGVCVSVDGMATCACDPGLYEVGTQCLEDPCEFTSCYFVDADRGNDAGPGSRAEPWQNLDRLALGLAEADAGDHFLLRRGRQWAGTLEIQGAQGEHGAPVVVGAYGPVAEPKPRLLPGVARVDNTDHVVVRDLWIEADGVLDPELGGPCVMIERSTFVTLRGNDIGRCLNRGVRLNDGAAYTVIADNRLWDVEDRAAIFVSDASWVPATIGPHHWVIDNVVTGTNENGITVAAVDITGDVKVVGNRVADTQRWGISVDTPGWTWVVGNVSARTGDPVGGLGGGISVGSEGPVHGNVVLESRLGMQLWGGGSVAFNTIIVDGDRAGLEVSSGASGLSVNDNLVAMAGGAPWLRLEGTNLDDDLTALDRQAYVADPGPCLFRALGMDLDLPGLVAATGLDAASVCGPVPGLGPVPTGVHPQDYDAAFWSSLTPGARWERCDAPAGARDCEGQALGAELGINAGFAENDGFGWEGPLLVRQRYPKP